MMIHKQYQAGSRPFRGCPFWDSLAIHHSYMRPASELPKTLPWTAICCGHVLKGIKPTTTPRENELWHPCQGFFLFSFGNFNVFGSQYFSAFPCSYLVPGWPCDHETRRGPKPSMYVRCRFLHMYLHKHHPIHFSVHMCKGVYIYIHLYSNLSSM